MAHFLDDWLGNFVEMELRSVLEWKHGVKTDLNVKADPESRFSDDGSNFRSIAGSDQLPNDGRVQLRSVISPYNPARILISDGITQIRAILSERALVALEVGLTEKLDLNVNGDVFSIREATVISTPYGPSDGFIQLSVDALEYHHHLRKPVGNPIPIEQHDFIARLVKDITETRRQESMQADEESNEQPASASHHFIASQAERNRSFQVNRPRPLAHSVRSSPDSTSSIPRDQVALATQVPAKRKATVPSLANDGFEVESGVNLERPKGPAFTANSSRPSGTHPKPVLVATTDTSLLLSLIRPQSDPSPNRHAEPIVIDNANFENAQLLVHENTDAREADVQLPETTREPAIGNGAAAPNSDDETIRFPVTQRRKHHKDKLPHGRRKIPLDQQRLLDNRTSWLPSIPGQQFPCPNVPITLLRRWNAGVAPLKSPQPVALEVEETETLSDAAMEESDDSDAELSSDVALSWDCSQSVSELPPDSSGKSAVHESPHWLPIRSPVKETTLIPNGTPGTVFQATQMSGNGDDMDMVVPRALSGDPALLHRQRRSEHFRAAQRREWLKANYTIADVSVPYFATVLSAYQTKHPEDVGAKAGLLHAIKDVFPKFINSSGQSLQPVGFAGRRQTPKSIKYVDGNQESVDSTGDAALPSPLRDPARNRNSIPNADAGTVRNYDPEDGADHLLSQQRRKATTPNHMRTETPHEIRTGVSSTPFPLSSYWKSTDASTESDLIVTGGNFLHSPPPPPPPPKLPEEAMDVLSEAATPEAEKQPMTPFEEFAQAWKSIKPGGFFAREQPPMLRRPRRIDVLSWDA